VQSRLPLVPGTCFTPREVVRLLALRQQYSSARSSLDCNLDECRLEFACWLVEYGRFGEGRWTPAEDKWSTSHVVPAEG